jgi:hypothetical protein
MMSTQARCIASRLGSSTSGRPAETSSQAACVGSSSELTQFAGTASLIRSLALTPVSAQPSPAIIATARATVATSGASEPMVSREWLSGTTPEVSISPNVGLKPTTPQRPAGMRTEPPVSLPTAQSQTPAATAAAEPPDDPPAMRVGSRGFRTVP